MRGLGATTFNSGTFQLSSVAGPAISGALIAVLVKHHHSHPAALVYGLNGVASLICFCLVTLIRREHKVAARQPLSLSNLGTGFKFVFHNKIILGTITLDLFAVLLGGATSLPPIHAKDILHAGADGLVCCGRAMPIGAVLCALISDASAAAAKGRPGDVVVRGGVWVGHHRVWFFPFVLASFAMFFICARSTTSASWCGKPSCTADARRQARARFRGQQLVHRHSNELGGFESGKVADYFGVHTGHTIATGAVISAVSGGVGTILVVIAVAMIWPQIRNTESWTGRSC